MPAVPKFPSAEAVSAALRVGGPMKDRRSPRGGTRNTHQDLCEEWAAEIEDMRLELEEDRS